MTSGCIGALTVGLAGALVCFLSGADDKEKAAHNMRASSCSFV